MSLTSKEEVAVRELLKEYNSGYLQEKTLLRAVKNISRHSAKKSGNWSLEWLFLLALTWFASAVITSPKDIHKPDKKIAATAQVAAAGFAPLQVEAPHLIDDSPTGSYDFTLVDPKTNSTSVKVPAPCPGVMGGRG